MAAPDQSRDQRWISEYDYPSRRIIMILAVSEALPHWVAVAIDERLSDPAGDFVVFSAKPRPDVGRRLLVKIVIRLDEVGNPLRLHPDFAGVVGSPTIWPYEVAGERFGLDHWLWWTEDPAFRREPRSWADAHEAPGGSI